MFFEKSEAGIKDMFMKEQSARAKYSQKIRSKEDTSSNYFDGSDDKKEKE